MHGLQTAWILAALLVARRGRGSRVSAALLLLVPAFYLGVHLVYTATIYYPRHLISGYLAMGVVALFAARSIGRSADATPASLPRSGRWRQRRLPE
jgi:hypothetical protein